MTKTGLIGTVLACFLAAACGGSQKPAEDQNDASASDKASEAAEKSGEAAEKATEKAGEKVEEAGDKAEEAGDKAKEKTKDEK